MHRFSPLLLALLGFACVVPKDARPRVIYGLDVATESNHRGMVQNETGVLEPSLTVALPAEQDGTIILRGAGQIDLSNDTGDAWRPSGHGGRFSSLDWMFLYEQVVDSYVMTFGLVNYNLPNGLEFQFGERGATTEVLAEFKADYSGTQPGLRIHYDVDEVEGLYLQGFVGREFELSDDWTARGDFSLGWMDEDQASWNYAQAPPHSGLADARLSGAFVYRIDEHTASKIHVAYSDVIDSEFRGWIEDLGIEAARAWIGIGIEWTY
ncbi:MAG: hypothetical protein ACI835_002352 [Planctomycetota bacterium]|jgi:hypothetical protein